MTGWGSGPYSRPDPRESSDELIVANRPRPWSGTTEQVGGSDSLFSSFNALSGTTGDWEYRADYSHRQSKPANA